MLIKINNKWGVFQWLLSMSEQNRGMLGLGGGLHSPFYKLSGINNGNFVSCICKSKHGRLRSDIHGIKNERKKMKIQGKTVGGYFRHLHSPKIILRKNTKNNFLHVSPDMLPGILGFIWNMQEERIMEPCRVYVVNIWLSFWLTWLCRCSLLKMDKKSCRTITIPE